MWTVDRLEEFFNKGIVGKSGGLRKRLLMDETRVLMVHIQAFPEIYRLFQLHQFEWMNNAPGVHTGHLLREFYAIYAATLMYNAAETKSSERAQKELAATFEPLETITMRGKVMDIFEASINRMLHGLEYSSPASIGLFEAKHHAVTNEAEMKNQTSREHIMRWIASYIAIEKEAATWVSDSHLHIKKASLTFPTKVWWSIVRAQLRATRNDNTLSPSLASLVACLMAGYLAGILPNHLVDKRTEATKITAASKIQDVNNPLFRKKSSAVGPLALVEHGEPSQTTLGVPSSQPDYYSLPSDQRQTRTVVDLINYRMAQLIQRDVLAAEKSINDEMQKELAFLKNKMDGVETVGSNRNEEFQKQLADMRVLVAKLPEQPIQVPTPAIPDSLINKFDGQPANHSLDDIWGDLPKSKSSKTKKNAGEPDEQTTDDLAIEETRQEKKGRRASKKKA
ncbi:hypothetical protein KY284_010836 [Solanum tuberosum]|nr:hypothetical protein KY284_010836 [Solanum tuberosum]